MTRHFLSGAAAIGLLAGAPALASSHMDAPLISLDDPANTTDVYAFVTRRDGEKYLTTALSVFPFEEPGIGPNAYRFDDRVKYAIHVALGEDIGMGAPTLSYEFTFQTTYRDPDSILQTYLGLLSPTGSMFPENQNMMQTYAVTKVDGQTRQRDVLARGLMVPPNNQGLVTPFYNQGDNGNNPAREGVDSEDALDPYTQLGIEEFGGYVSFAGQRDDGFYADIQSIFDLDFSFTGGDKPFDSQGGFNVHTIVLNIPYSELEAAGTSIADRVRRRVRDIEPEPLGLAGVFATTSRARVENRSGTQTVFDGASAGRGFGAFQQVGRQGNPLFAEALLPLKDKDPYNQESPRGDSAYRDSVTNPQLSQLLGTQPIVPGLLEAIYLPDLIKIDLTTEPARLAGQDGFDRLSVFGGDVLVSELDSPLNLGGVVPGGWPNGRRFGDDVIDIAAIALGLAGPLDGIASITTQYAGADVDRVTENDITYNTVFPYAATPLNGRNHTHHNDDDG